MAYWSYHGAGGMTSTIDTILDKESFELNELLADEELLQECKALNSRLIAYLSKPEVIEQLFTYIMVEPTAEDTNERCYTYPYVSSELLSCDITQIHEAITSADCAEQLRRLLAFAEPAGPLNPVLIGYYSKVISTLFKHNPTDFLEKIDAHASGGRMGYLKTLINHLDMQSVSDLLATLTTPIETLTAAPPPPMMLGGMHAREAQARVAGGGDDDEKADHWLDVADFSCTLLESARASRSAEVHALTATLFTGLVGHYGWGVMVAHPPLVAKLLEVALDAPDQTARTCALSMLSELLRLHAFERSLGQSAAGAAGGGTSSTDGGGGGGDAESEGASGAAAKRDAQLAPLLQAIGEQIEGFVLQLNLEPVLAAHLNPFLQDGGYADSLQLMPVGSARVALYAFLAKLLPYAPRETALALAECRLLEIALDAFERYPNNNMLHTHITSIVLFALRDDGAAPELALSLVRDAKIGRRLAALSDPSESGGSARLGLPALDGFSPGPPATARSPRAGHVIVMGNALVAKEERCAEVKAALAEDGEAWRAFVDGPLAAANANERITLGGQAPQRNSDQEDSDDDELFQGSKELDLDAMAAALAKHQAAVARSSGGGDGGGFGGGGGSGADRDDDDDDDDDDGLGGGGSGSLVTSAAEEAELQKRFGAYMGHKGPLHELDGGIGAISREEDARNERGGWQADFAQDDEPSGSPFSSAEGGDGDAPNFGSTQRDFFLVGSSRRGRSGGGGDGGNGRNQEEEEGDDGGRAGGDDPFGGRASLGGGGDDFFGNGVGSGSSAESSSFDSVFGGFGGGSGGGMDLGGAEPFAVDFGELSSEAEQQAGAFGGGGDGGGLGGAGGDGPDAGALENGGGAREAAAAPEASASQNGGAAGGAGGGAGEGAASGGVGGFEFDADFGDSGGAAEAGGSPAPAPGSTGAASTADALSGGADSTAEGDDAIDTLGGARGTGEALPADGGFDADFGDGGSQPRSSFGSGGDDDDGDEQGAGGSPFSAALASPPPRSAIADSAEPGSGAQAKSAGDEEEEQAAKSPGGGGGSCGSPTGSASSPASGASASQAGTPQPALSPTDSLLSPDPTDATASPASSPAPSPSSSAAEGASKAQDKRKPLSYQLSDSDDDGNGDGGAVPGRPAGGGDGDGDDDDFGGFSSSGAAGREADAPSAPAPARSPETTEPAAGGAAEPQSARADDDDDW